jgi:hypothetical protein
MSGAEIGTMDMLDEAVAATFVTVMGAMGMEFASMTAHTPTISTEAAPIYGSRYDIFIRYYQVSLDTNICLHMFV